MSISRAEFFEHCNELVGIATKTPRLNDEARLRLSNISAHLERQRSDFQPLQREALIADEVAKAYIAHFKLLLLAQVRGCYMKNAPKIGETGLRDFRANQRLASASLNYQQPDYIRRLMNSLNFEYSSLPQDSMTIREHQLPGTNVTLKTILTGIREPGFRPVDPRVGGQIERIARENDVDYFVSSALGQGNNPYEFPEFLGTYIGRAPLPQGIELFGSSCFRSSTKADASIISAEPRVGHFSAIAGAGFGQLCEVDENGELARHANIFLGPNNVLGADNSVLACTLNAGGFNLERCFLVVEHQEGDIYAVDLPTDQQLATGTVPKHLERNASWLRRAESRFGEEGRRAIIPGTVSTHLPRQGKPIFNLAEMIRREALACGIPGENIIVNDECPTIGDPENPKTMLRHWSNTVETALFPGQFVDPGTQIPPDNLLLWPRNGYFTVAQRSN